MSELTSERTEKCQGMFKHGRYPLTPGTAVTVKIKVEKFPAGEFTTYECAKLNNTTKLCALESGTKCKYFQ